jgi:hypothetical protein
MNQQNYYFENGYATESNLQIWCNPHQNSSDILHRPRKGNPKTYVEAQKTMKS